MLDRNSSNRRMLRNPKYSKYIHWSEKGDEIYIPDKQNVSCSLTNGACLS